jgi:MFS family permease
VVYIAYSLTAITGPTIGVIVGGYITTKVIGGYTSRWAIYVCLGVGLMASMVGIPMPYVNNFWAFLVCLWLLLFFGGFMMPNLTGILLNSVPIRERSMANAIANFIYNGFGYLPAPYLYGLVAQLTAKFKDGKNISRYGMYMLMWSSIIGVASLGIAVCLNHSSRIRAKKLAKQEYGGEFEEGQLEEMNDQLDEENRKSMLSKSTLMIDNNMKL